MHSPPIEWSMWVGHFVALDVIRDRGEADGDTASECIRDLVARTPHGRHLFTAALVLGGLAFRHHILAPLKET